MITYAESSERVGLVFTGAVKEAPLSSGMSKSNVSPTGPTSESWISICTCHSNEKPTSQHAWKANRVFYKTNSKART